MLIPEQHPLWRLIERFFSIGNEQRDSAPVMNFFAVDLRSLAVIRIGLGICVIGDIWYRLQYVHEHYSNEGTLPCKFSWGM